MSTLTCSCGEFSFYVTYGVTTTEVYPLNFLETALVDELEPNQIFYRRKFQGQLVFGGQKLKADFTYFWDIEQVAPCTRLYLQIWQDATLYWEGYFATSNGAFDLDACTFTVTPLVDDLYAEILDGADIEYNLLLSGEIPEVDCIFDNGNPADDETYTHCRMFIDVIEYLVDQLIPGALVDSTFFEQANNPVTLTTNRYNYLTIAQKSDIKKPNATNSATVGMMSFNQVMEICRCMNLYWDVVIDTGVLTVRVEHVSFWPLTAGPDIRNQKIARGTNKYRYLNETMPKYEKFSWMEAGYIDFTGYPIWYDSDCVNQESLSNTIEYNFANVTTDLEYIRERVADVDDLGSSISNDGWVLLANEDRAGSLYIWSNIGIIDNVNTHFNVDMAWSWLHNNFWKHDRQLITGYMNNAIKTFYTAKKVKQQECSIAICNDFDPMEYLTTELGETYFSGEKAKIGRAVIKPYGQIDLNLLYGPDDNVNPGITYGKYIQIKEVQTDDSCDYFAICNQAADVQLTINIEIVVADADSDTCSVNDDIVIAAGDYAGNVTIAWCATMATPNPPYCIDITNVTGPGGGWTVFLDRDFDAYCT